MEIAKEIYSAHQKLSNCSARFLDFVKDNPESLNRSNFPGFELNYGYGKIKLQSWPTFINKRTKKEIEKASVGVCQLIKSLPLRMFSNNPSQVSRYYEISDHMARTLLDGINEVNIYNLLARGDFTFSSSGLKCLEYNITANLGGLQVGMWEALYLKNPIVSRFLHQYKYNQKISNENLISILLTHFIRTALDKFSDSCHVINIAVAAPGTVDDNLSLYLNHLYKKALQSAQTQALKKLTGRIIFCGYHDLEVVNNVILYKGDSVHILAEMYEGAVPPDFVNVMKSGNVIIYNGHISGLMSNKFNLVLLSENESSDIFTAEEKELIAKYIPWTRKVVPGETTFEGKVVNLEDFIGSNRKRLVIKPTIGSRGDFVYIGQNMQETRWTEIVQHAFHTRGWLVQEYVESSPYLYQVGQKGSAPHHAVWGFFVFGSRYAGGYIRVLPKVNNTGVVNSSLGAYKSAILEIEE